MRHLYHYWFCPNSRKVRISLLEKSMDCELILELPWKRRHEFLTLNPSGSVPVLVEDDDLILSGTSAICEYLEETGNLPNFLGKTPTIRGEVRRLSDWFDSKFYNEVTNLIINEKVMKGFLRRGNTQAANIRFAGQNIKVGEQLRCLGCLCDIVERFRCYCERSKSRSMIVDHSCHHNFFWLVSLDQSGKFVMNRFRAARC